MTSKLVSRLFTLGLSLASIALVAPSAQAQELDAKSAARVKQHYLADLDSTHAKIMALANAIPEEKYGWRPAPGVRSVSEVLMHLVGEWDYYAPGSVGGKPPADFGSPREALPALEKVTGKAAILAQLEKSWAYCQAQMAAADAASMTGTYKPWGVTLEEAAFGMTGDQHEHLGQLIAYARSVGVKPPWSKM
ncbi:MAG: DinB-like domain protein [Gemmatimonadetes bacterium]|nr:DinB-like domain protein [Gemmatimonadota bacterium]